MSKFEYAVLTMIKYRWDSNKLFMRWGEIAEAIESATGYWFNKDTQLYIRKQKSYREKVYGFLMCENRVSEISRRAEKYNKTSLEYVAYLFGIKPDKVVPFFRMLDFDLPTKFKHDDSMRKSSEIRKSDPKRGNGDCVVRAITVALGLSYDEVLMDLEKLQKEDPTKGTSDLFWQPYVVKRGWTEIKVKTWKRTSLHKMLDIIPELRKVPMLVCVSAHLFYIDGTGTNIDTWDAAYKDVVKILVRKQDYNYVTGLIGGELSIEGMVHKLLNCRRKHPNISWKFVYEKINIRWYEGQEIRRRREFHKQVENTEEYKWALHKKR